MTRRVRHIRYAWIAMSIASIAMSIASMTMPDASRTTCAPAADARAAA